MREHELKIGKYYRKVAVDGTLKTHIGVVFQVSKIDMRLIWDTKRTRYTGPVVYAPPDTWFGRVHFCTEDFDIYEEVTEPELTALKLSN